MLHRLFIQISLKCRCLFLLRMLWSQQNYSRKKSGAFKHATDVFLAWCKSLLSASGVAHIFILVCFVGQVVMINLFLVKYMSSTILLTLIVDVPLFIHLAWFWREESAHRAAATQWFTYSWIHAAKVVVLYCRVMPRLPTSRRSDEVVVQNNDFGISAVDLNTLYSPTTLANLLFFTPVFYCLLMFRTSKAVFGGLFRKRITVDLIMHYDMLWHVVIDMVDQVDMFYFARLPEWVQDDVLEQHQQSIVLLQTVVPFFLFIAIVMQAQAFPGVITDRWIIPTSDVSTLRATESARPTSSSSVLKRTDPSPSLRERILGFGHQRSEATQRFTSAHFRSPQQPASRTLPLPVQLGQPSLSPLPGTAPGEDAKCTVRTKRLGSLSTLSARRPALQPLQLSPPLDSQPPPTPQLQQAAPMATSSRAQVRWSQDVGNGDAAVRKHSPGNPSVGRDSLIQEERLRRRRLLAVTNLIQRQTIITARKRSAMVSIFFVDIPFLAVRIWLWALQNHTYFPGLGVKNGICIILNVMQYTVVALASRESFREIQRQLTLYISRSDRKSVV